MAKVVLTQKQIVEDPNILWNTFIEVIGGGEDPTRTPLQRHCHLCFKYYSEVMNGGHFQFFENSGVEYARDVLSSLHGLGLTEGAEILEDALRIAGTRPWQVIGSVEEFVESSAEGLFERQDDAFYSLSPDLLDLLQEIGNRQRDKFITIIP